MPRYYFHYQYADDRVLEDRVGTSLEDLEDVEREGRSIALEILSDELQRGGSVDEPRCLEIEDDQGDIVLYLPFWAAMALPVAR